MKLLYLHGFRSSPQSVKAQKCFAKVELLRKQGQPIDWYCPQLPPSPKAAMQMVLAHIKDWQGYQMAVIGSSLGGYYAHYIAELKHCGAVLLNPAVAPAKALKKALEEGGEISKEDEYYVEPTFIQELESLYSPVTLPERYFLIAAKGDELLDYRAAVERYKQCEKLVLEGSDHQLTDFDDYIHEVFDFIGLSIVKNDIDK